MRPLLFTLLLTAPAVAAPPIVIEIPAPGLDSRAVADTVTAPLEKHLLAIPGVRHVRSLSADGHCLVRLDLDLRADRAQLRAAVANRLAKDTAARLRPDAEDAVIVVAVRSDGRADVAALTTAAERVRPRLATVPQVAEVVPFGAAEYGLRVYVDSDKLAVLDLTPGDMVAALRPVTAPGLPALTPAALGDLAIGNRNGQPLNLRDVAVARLVVERADAAGVARVGDDPAPAVLLLLRPAPGAVAAVNAAVGRLLDRPGWDLPAGVSVERLAYGAGDTAVTLRLPAGSEWQARDRMGARVAAAAARAANVRSVAWLAGPGDDAVTLLVSGLGADLAKLAPPGVAIRVGRMRWPLDDWPGEGATIVARVSGADTVAVMAATLELRERLAGVAGVADLIVEPGERPRMRYDVDRNKLGHLSLTAAAVNEVIELATTGVRVGSVTVETPRRRKVDDLLAVRIPNAQGQQVPLGAVVAAREELGPTAIYRQDGRPGRVVSCNVRGRDVADVRADVRAAVRQLAKPGVTIVID